MQIIQREFYNRSSELVAKNLIGKTLIRRLDKRQLLSGVIVETEAYLGLVDPASHSFIGMTERNKVLFGPPGHAYIHSMHRQNLLDIVCGKEGNPISVLIRALEPLEGIETMKRHREKEKLKDLCSGPGKLCQALQIDKSFYGVDITNKSSKLYIVDSKKDYKVANSPRIGISKGKDYLVRFIAKDSKFISR